MRQILSVKKEQEVLSLIPGIAFSNVSSWYGSTRRDLKMDIIAPKVREGHKLCPAIVWICGGAYRVVDRSVWLPQMVFFAQRGYVIASIEYRTSNEAQFPDPLIDCKAAVRYLKAHAEAFCIDPNRICAMGESAGGTMASLLGTTKGITDYDKGDYLDESSDVKAVVDFYGLTDLTDGPMNIREDIPEWALQDFLGVKYTDSVARRASAVYYVNAATPPFMIFHGDDDLLVPIKQSETLYYYLQKYGVDSEFYILKGAGHGADEFYQREVLERIITFLNRVLAVE